MKKAKSSGKSLGGSKTGKSASAKKSKPAEKSGKTVRKVVKIPSTGSLSARIAAAKRMEAGDRPKIAPRLTTRKPRAAAFLTPAAAKSSAPQRNSDFPNTYIQAISVRLEDPDHPVTLTWTGPSAGAQETGPFRSSPGAGLRGLNCDDVATSRRSGSTCTPKGTFTVTGFAPHLNSHPEATDVTWFVPARGIALHYYPSVPTYPASHGCVRLESRRIAQLIQNNSRAGVTMVIVDGTWTKPAHQY